MLIRRFLVVAATIATLTVSALAAPNVTGLWHGKIVMKMPKAQNAQQQQGIDRAMAMLRNMKLTLTLKANHTYTANVVGGPAGNKQDSDSGKWSQSGSTITLTPNPKPGHPAGHPEKVQVMGNKLVVSFPGASGGQVVFTR